MKWRGFTIVELAITITIMGILLTLAVVSLNSSQANARDSERKGDAEAIVLNLESYYNNSSQDSQGNLFMSGGTYPGVDYLTTPTFSKVLPDIDPKSTHAPGVDVNEPMSLVQATNNVQTTSGVQPQPSKNNDVYVYQPLTKNGSLCADPFINGECRKFNIYYYQEVSNSVQQLTSKNQ